MALTADMRVPQNALMLGTELAYVRKQLKRCSAEEREAARKAAKVHVKTLRRIAARETENPSALTVGRLALHFKTREKRQEIA